MWRETLCTAMPPAREPRAKVHWASIYSSAEMGAAKR
jgi:hypothetical protein